MFFALVRNQMIEVGSLKQLFPNFPSLLNESEIDFIPKRIIS